MRNQHELDTPWWTLRLGTYFDIAVRDTVMAVGAFVLAKLTEVRAQRAADVPARSRTREDGIAHAASVPG